MLSTLTVLLTLVAPQGEADAEAIERFAGLRSMQKAILVSRVRNHLSLTSPAFERIRAMRLDAEELPEAEPAPVFDPQRWAKIAPPRKPLPRDHPTYIVAQKRFARTPLLGDLHVRVHYDWCRGEIVAHEEPLAYEQVFENLLNGYPPDVDHAIARVLAELDTEPMRGFARWFGHTYADLQANTYPGITLYDAWYSGEVVMVPDVDAIPFAHELLGQTHMKSPLSGKPRDELYDAIRDAALVYRKHRTLREAAAAAFVRVEPAMDAMYARLVPRFHVLWPECDDSLAKLAKLLKSEDRDAVVEDVDQRVAATGSTAWKVRLARERELREMQAACRTLALEQLASFAPK